MRAVLSWLNEMVPLGSDHVAIADDLNELGLAVEDVVVTGQAVPGVVVAAVQALRRHPKADRIQLVDVDLGDGQPLQICCGAFNMAVGDRVPLATLGTVMPNGMEIARRQLRGEWSNGMLCSSTELGLDGDDGGIRILPAEYEVGRPLWDAMGLDADVVFDLDVTRNRPDAWCHLGIARDLAAWRGLPLTAPDPVITSAGPTPLTVVIDEPERCGRFTARLITGVTVTTSPPALADRIVKAGMRPINNVVDVSNLVMIELGQPNHTYDLSRLQGGGFIIRRARGGERLVTLDGVERVLTTDDLLICDGHDAPIGLAGVMGGAATEIDDASTTIALEMAWFEPTGVAATAARHGLRSEASARFERGIDTEGMERAGRRFVDLLRLTCPDAQLHDLVVTDGVMPVRPAVEVRTAKVNAVLATALTTAQIVALLDPIGFTSTPAADQPDVLLVDLPTWRYDASSEIDVVEEVARHHGYSRLAKVVPPSAHAGALTERQLARRRVIEIMVGAGFNEAMPNPFLAPGDLARVGLPADGLTIANPLAAEESVLRTSLRPGLLRAVAYNESHRQLGVLLFELGHVWRRPTDPSAALPDEPEILAAVLAGRDAREAVRLWEELTLGLRATGVQIVAATPPGLHPTRSAELVSANGPIGLVGEVAPSVLAALGITGRVAWLEVDVDGLLAAVPPSRSYARVSRYPSSDVDLAFVVADDVPAAAITEAVATASADLVVDASLFDVYRGPGMPDGHRGLAYRLRLQSADRTLTDADVAAVRAAVIAAVAPLGATLRS